ncbi:MAG: nucleoside recognition domain-containing protein [Oscillospiraceae bacterium]
MMNYIWPIILIFSVVAAIFTGNVDNLSNSIFSSVQGSITLILKLLGSFCLWGGIMNIAEKSGLTKKISKLMSPLLNLIFSNIKTNEKLKSAISMNITANLLGLGNAATPLGIEAMKRFDKDKLHPENATNNMILFVVLNTAAIKLIPTTVAQLRFEHGSLKPMEILLPSLITSVIAVSVALIISKLIGAKKYD